MILYMIIYIPSGHQTWQLKFPNLERGFPTATFDYWRVFDLIWSLMLLRVTPPHRCNNCQRLQIDTDGWWAARLGTFVATAGCDTLGSGSKCEGVQAFRVSRATWRLTKSQTKSQAESNLKSMQRVGSVEQNLQRLLYHVISLSGWTLQYCCRMVSEWYTWSVWKDLKLKGFLLSCFGWRLYRTRTGTGGR